MFSNVGKRHRLELLKAEFKITRKSVFLFSFQKARFEKGKELLEAEFRSLLTRHSKAVPPILILDAISVDEELEVQEEVVLEHLPEAVLRDIVCIAGWLVENGRNQGLASRRLSDIVLLGSNFFFF